jgi:pyridoxal-phosphate dependent enzyme
MVCAQKGYPVVVTMSESFSIERCKLMRFLGAKVVLTPGAGRGLGIVAKTIELAEKHGWFFTCQFENEANADMHSMTGDFQEIAHAGGTVIFKAHTTEKGEWFYSIAIAGTRPVPMMMIGLWALSPGLVVASLPMGGMGSGMPPTPLPGCLAVYMIGDSEGRFGHHCPRCGGYWRSGPWPNLCPYCATMAQSYSFLSNAQQRYVTALLCGAAGMVVSQRPGGCGHQHGRSG